MTDSEILRRMGIDDGIGAKICRADPSQYGSGRPACIHTDTWIAIPLVDSDADQIGQSWYIPLEIPN